MIRGPVAEINLSAIAHNLHFVKRITKNRPVIAVVKADAYGHGAVAVSKKLLQLGISHLAVAFVSEALELRESGIDSPILVLFDHGDPGNYFDYDLLPVISRYETARQLSEEARKRTRISRVHVKIDTGMGRLGLRADDAIQSIMKISEMPGLEIIGLMSHFSEADLADTTYATFQLEHFNKIVLAVTQKVGNKIVSHIANSAAVIALEKAHLNAVRPGLMLYGYSPFCDNQCPELMPAMTVKARIIDIRNVPEGTPISYGRTFVTRRPSRIGVLALGYADGYSRLFSNNAYVLVKGKKVSVVGRVCMDLTMVDLTDTVGVETGDEAVIIGKQGEYKIGADELAARAQTIPYEILTSLGSRSKKVYVENY